MDSLNPYCSGQWPRTLLSVFQNVKQTSLNPYCSGQWPRTFLFLSIRYFFYQS